MQPSELTPDELRYFKTYQKGLRYHEEYVANCQEHTSLEDNRKSIECLSTYGLKFLDIYIEPLLQDTEESLNIHLGLTSQYEYRDTCHTKEWDWQSYKEIKSSIAALTVGFKTDNNVDNTLTFDELHTLIKKMWTNYYGLAKLANRLSDMLACLEDWRRKQSDIP